MRHRKKLLTLICAFSLLTVASFNSAQLNPLITNYDPASEISVRADLPIAISGNAALNTTASAGNGTAGNPYIIENLVIDAGSAHGINISNTDAYFTLRNCSIQGMASSYAGIYLENVTNGLIFNNTVDNAGYGIYLLFTDYSTLDSNYISSCGDYGIWLFLSSYNNISNNYLYNNDEAHIRLETSSDSNELVNNTIDYGIWDGLQLIDVCGYNGVINNTIIDIGQFGILLDDSTYNTTIYLNTLDNNWFGIYLDHSAFWNNISYNQFLTNGFGIFVESGNDNLAYRNNIWYSTIKAYNDSGTGNVWLENLLSPDGDFDNDSIYNAWELNHPLLDPWNADDASADPDGDGLTNLGEFQNETDLNDSDSDDDGLSDGAEVIIHHTNPMNPDTEGDGLLDGIEIEVGADPFKSDTDNDLLPDKYEVDNLLSPINAQDAIIDIEADGLTNIQEYFYNTSPYDADTDDDGYTDGDEVAAGTNPLNPDSYPVSEPEDNLLEIVIIIGFVSLAGAIIAHGIFIWRKPTEPQLSKPKQTK